MPHARTASTPANRILYALPGGVSSLRTSRLTSSKLSIPGWVSDRNSRSVSPSLIQLYALQVRDRRLYVELFEDAVPAARRGHARDARIRILHVAEHDRF